MIAAFLEWFLWVAAFLYCLWKVFVKAEHWTVRVLAIIVGIAFTALRYSNAFYVLPLEVCLWSTC
jgi:chitin synthase